MVARSPADMATPSGLAKPATAEAVNAAPNVSVDVGQILFGQTVTASGDSMLQYRNARHGRPAKWVVMDIECDAGCGVVPFRYRDRDFVNALQWAIGLELFLMVRDPWRDQRRELRPGQRKLNRPSSRRQVPSAPLDRRRCHIRARGYGNRRQPQARRRRVAR